jgi:hypothetical protein
MLADGGRRIMHLIFWKPDLDTVLAASFAGATSEDRLENVCGEAPTAFLNNLE